MSPKLDTLPVEILDRIILSLDQPSGLSFALVSSRFPIIAETAIWRNINMAVNGFDIIYDSVLSPGHDGRELGYDEALETEAEHRKALNSKVRQILKGADERRRKMIEIIRIVSRTGSIKLQFEILERSASSLRELVIEAPTPHVFDSDSSWQVDERFALDHHFSVTPISFSQLRFWKLGRQAIRSPDSLRQLCSVSPLLYKFDLSLDSDMDFQPLPKDLERSTSLVISSGEYPGDFTQFDKVVKYLDLFSDLRALVLMWDLSAGRFEDGKESALEANRLMVTCALSWRIQNRCEGLQKLSWSLEFDLLDEALALEVEAEDSWLVELKQLAVGFLCQSRWIDIYLNLPNFPFLESLFLISIVESRDFLFIPPTANATSTIAVSLAPPFVDRLCTCWSLHTIHLLPPDITFWTPNLFEEIDKIVRSGIDMGRILSISVGDHELIHARILVAQVEEEDIPHDAAWGLEGIKDYLLYETEDGQSRRRVYRNLDSPQWHDQTDYRGKVVPLEVIDQVRIAAGINKAKWRGRELIVGERGRQVIMKWYAALMREEKKLCSN